MRAHVYNCAFTESSSTNAKTSTGVCSFVRFGWRSHKETATGVSEHIPPGARLHNVIILANMCSVCNKSVMPTALRGFGTGEATSGGLAHFSSVCVCVRTCVCVCAIIHMPSPHSHAPPECLCAGFVHCRTAYHHRVHTVPLHKAHFASHAQQHTTHYSTPTAHNILWPYSLAYIYMYMYFEF